MCVLPEKSGSLHSIKTIMKSGDNAYQTLLEDFLKFNILVKCPICGGKATVHTSSFSTTRQINKEIKVVCTHCGFSKVANDTTSKVSFQLKNNTISGTFYMMGGPIDPFFQIPVWLQTNVSSNLLWAYNQEHLSFLKIFVSAQMRERNNEKPYSNKSLGSRLPKWMTAAKNREDVLKKISQLEKLCDKSF